MLWGPPPKYAELRLEKHRKWQWPSRSDTVSTENIARDRTLDKCEEKPKGNKAKRADYRKEWERKTRVKPAVKSVRPQSHVRLKIVDVTVGRPGRFPIWIRVQQLQLYISMLIADFNHFCLLCSLPFLRKKKMKFLSRLSERDREREQEL